MSNASSNPIPSADQIVTRIERLPFLPFHMRMVGMLGLSMLFDAFDVYVIGVVTVLITSFKVSDASIGFVVSASYVGQFAGTLTLGYMSELYGRKPAFIWALGSFGLLSFLATSAWSAESLAWIRVFQGIGIGAVPPLAGVMLSEFLPRTERGKWGALFQCLYPVGVAGSPALGAMVLYLFEPDIAWRVLFLFGGIPLVLAIWFQFAVSESPRWLVAHGRVAEADKIVNVIEADARKTGIVLPPPKLQIVADSKKTRLLELFTKEYRSRTILIWVQSFTAFFVVNAFTSFLPRLYTTTGGLPLSWAFALTAVFGVCELGIRIVMAMVWDRTGRVPWFVYGYAASVFGAFAAWAAFDIFHSTSWIILATFGMMGALGCNISVGGVYVYHPELYPTRMRSWATSTGRAMRSVASIISPLIIGQILAAKLGPGPVFLMFGLVALVGLIVMWRLGVETKQTTLETIAR